MWKIGDRVVVKGDGPGIIEEFDDGMVRVRLRTPDDEPSCLSSWCFPDSLSDGSNVLPQPMSKAWRREAALFCQAVTSAFRGL